MAVKLTTCKACGAEIATNAKACPKCGAKNKKPLYKRWWFDCLILVIVISIIGGTQSSTRASKPAAGSSTPASAAADTSSSAGQGTAPAASEPEVTVPTEYASALKKAKSYSDLMHMSKAAIYDQLVSEYGERFPAEAAQYAVDNLNADYAQNALKKAESYSNTMHMSKNAIYDQLISEYGEQFTSEEAQYAIDHLD